MRINELLEASSAETARRKKASAQSKRANAASPAPVRKTGGIPANVPDRSTYITNPPMKFEKDLPGAFAGSEFDAYRDEPTLPSDDQGLALRFHIETDSKTKKPQVWGYWSSSVNSGFSAADAHNRMLLGNELVSPKLIELISNLVDRSHLIVMVDYEIYRAFPQHTRILSDWCHRHADDFDNELTFDRYTTPDKAKAAAPIVTTPKGEVNIPNRAALEAAIMQNIRSTPKLASKYAAADEATKKAALDAGTVLLNKTKDMAAALDDVDAMLDPI